MKKALLVSIIFCLVVGSVLADNSGLQKRSPILLTASKAKPMTDVKFWNTLKNTVCMKDVALSDEELNVLDATYLIFNDPFCCASWVSDRNVCLQQRKDTFNSVAAALSLLVNQDLKSLLPDAAGMTPISTISECSTFKSESDDSKIYVSYAKCELDNLVTVFHQYQDNISKLKLKLGEGLSETLKKSPLDTKKSPDWRP